MVFQVAVDQYGAGRAGAHGSSARLGHSPMPLCSMTRELCSTMGTLQTQSLRRIVKQVCTMLCCLLQDPSITSVEPICMSLDEWQMLPCRCVNALILPLYYTSIVDS